MLSNAILKTVRKYLFFTTENTEVTERISLCSSVLSVVKKRQFVPVYSITMSRQPNKNRKKTRTRLKFASGLHGLPGKDRGSSLIPG